MIGNDMRQLLALLPKPGILLDQRIPGPVPARAIGEIAVDDDIADDSPVAAGLYEGEIEIRQEIETERISRSDGGALLGPAAAGDSLDVNFPGRLRSEQVLAEFKVMNHGETIVSGEAGRIARAPLLR